jgi:hypothetical protein
MLNTNSQIITEVLVRASVSTTTTTSGGLYTDTNLNNELVNAYRWACGYKKWPFTEGRVSTTYAQEEMSYPEGWRTDSIRFIQVGGERYQKLNFEDYQIFRDENSNSEEKVYSDYARVIFINPEVASGSIVAYGQYTPTLDPTDDGSLSVFSNNEEEGNEAIVEEMLSSFMIRERKPKDALLHHQKAIEILERVWKNHADEQFAYHSKNRGMFERIDVVDGDYYDEGFKRDQF